MIVLELILLGLIFEVLTRGKGAPKLAWPVNIFVGAGIIILLILIYTLYKKKPIIRWLSSIPAAISAITFFAFVVLLLGFIPQDNPEAGRVVSMIGLTSVKSSWLMMISGMYFLVTLGFVAIRRALPLNRKNLGFLINHAGLWITIAAGYLGSGDLQRLSISLMEGHDFTSNAYNQKTQQVIDLPFSIKLEDFYIDQYNPKIGLLDARTNTLYNEDENSLVLIEDSLKTSILHWDLQVLEYWPDALRGMHSFYRTDSVGSAPAARIIAINKMTGDTTAGWVSSGSFRVRQEYMMLDQHYYLVMLSPEPRKFASDIILTSEDKEEIALTLEVNKPFKYSGWKLYQQSYDDRMGKWSQISIIEAVRDPWLPVVYTGIFLLLAGAVYLFWKGREIKES